MSDLDKKVLEAIAERRLAPRPYAYFLAKRSVFWALAALSVVLGGASVAVIIYRILDHFDSGGRGFDEMPFDDIAELLPGVWLVSFALFTASAVFAVSRTKRGYRHRRRNVIAAVVAASAALGLVLFWLGVGPRVHNFLAGRFDAYREFTTIPYEEWSRPDEGFLGGEALSEEPGRLRLKAFDGKEWEVDTAAAKILVSEPLVEEGDVAVRGTRTGESSFKAESVDAFD